MIDKYICDRCQKEFTYFSDDTLFEYNQYFDISTGFYHSKRKGTEDDIHYCFCRDCCHEFIDWVCEKRIEKHNKENKQNELLEELNKFTKRENNPDDIFIFTVKLCDNKIDRDNERFTESAIEQMEKLFIGKSGFVGNNCQARIFKTYIEHVADQTCMSKNHMTLFGVAYMIRTESNKDIIKEIESGIKKEVSISCSCLKKTCAVCGKNILKDGKNVLKESCDHVKGKEYTFATDCLFNHTFKCYYEISDITDVYEWSFVEVPYSNRNNVGGE
jgi:hypothetical protein